jgi:glycosyltransferase involved in cell wall biosynthesis
MSSLRVLITNNTLDARGGSELYVRDLALALLARGHRPVAYSPLLGEVARELRQATVPVIDELGALTEAPDIIHGHHHLETMTALLRFPGVPAVSYCHGWAPWEEWVPRFPRIRRYVAVDEVCRERLLCECGILPERVRTIFNFVDLERFKSRAPLPARPRRALVLDNAANENRLLPVVREACARTGLDLDVLGIASGRPTSEPEKALPEYDIVFAKARSALEAMAVGTAVVLCWYGGAGPLVGAADFDRLRAMNFGIRAANRPLDAEGLVREILQYDAADAAAVSGRVRTGAGLEAAIDAIVALYLDVLSEHPLEDAGEEGHLASAYLRSLSLHVKERDLLLRQLQGGLAAAERERDLLLAERAALSAKRDELRADLTALEQLRTLRWRRRLLGFPGVRKAYGLLFGRREKI